MAIAVAAVVAAPPALALPLPLFAFAVSAFDVGGFVRSPRTFFFSGTFVRTAVCTITPLLSSGRRTVSVVALCMMVTVFSFRFVRLPSSFALSTSRTRIMVTISATVYQLL
uniref:Secreted protein n=1 Tax=Anopheles darlingi TaxID=43151 RepID=A0A2M4D679_ANODA